MTKRLILTLCILHLFQPLSQRRTIFKLQTSLVSNYGFIVSPRAVQGSPLSCVALSPVRIHFDALDQTTTDG